MKYRPVDCEFDAIRVRNVFHAIRNDETDKLPEWLKALYCDRDLWLEFNSDVCDTVLYIDTNGYIRFAYENDVIVYSSHFNAVFICDAAAFDCAYNRLPEQAVKLKCKFNVCVVENKDYPWCVQVLSYIEGDWVYAGVGRFCVNLLDVYNYITEYKRTLNEADKQLLG